MLPIPPIIGCREVAANRFFRTLAEELATADGAYTYNFIASTWDAVVVVPVLGDGRLVVERIYRHPYQAYLHEFPAGGIDAGEDPLAAGARELEEETGWRAARMRPLATYLPMPGLVRMRVHVVLAEGLEQQGTLSHEALELIEVEECTLAQAWAYAEGEQASAFLLQGLLLYERALRAGGQPGAAGGGMTAYWICDAFAARPFSGNPAAVVPLDGPAPEAWMQAVAGEFNLSETAFCWPEEGGWRLRWFTPQVEVELCGHATLAGAAVLWRSGRCGGASIAFRTCSGPLAAQRLDAAAGRIRLDFPATPCTALREPGEALSEALGARVCWLGANAHDWLVELDDAETVAGLAPDFGRLAELPVRGIAVTARGGPTWGCDLVSRFFAPRVGIAEDPVTGSSHCALAPYWSPRLGKKALACRQLSPRGGELEAEVAGERVLLSGAAVVVAEGRLLTPRS